MKLSVTLMAVAVLGSAARSSSLDAVIIQAMHLEQAPNYTWVTSVSNDREFFSFEGRMQKDGYARLRLPLIPGMGARLHCENEQHVDVVFLGRNSFVLQTLAGWIPQEEFRWDAPMRSSRPDTFALARGVRHGGRMGTLGAPLPRPSRAASFDSRALRLVDDLHLGLALPHEELALIVSSFVDLEVEGGIVTGNLSELGAALLLFRDGQAESANLTARGSFKLWVGDGGISRYQLRLEGALDRGRQRLELRRQTNTVIRDVGATRFDVPEAARVLLGP